MYSEINTAVTVTESNIHKGTHRNIKEGEMGKAANFQMTMITLCPRVRVPFDSFLSISWALNTRKEYDHKASEESRLPWQEVPAEWTGTTFNTSPSLLIYFGPQGQSHMGR